MHLFGKEAMAIRLSPLALLLALSLSGVAAGAQDAGPPTASAASEIHTGPVVYRAQVVATYPHDDRAFTQGLLWHDGSVIESTGLPGRSDVREVKLETGEVIQRQAIAGHQFGEGIALWDDAFVSLTWRDGAIYRWDAETLEPREGADNFAFEGWGLTTGPEGLIHSDGSDRLRVLDPETFEVLRSVDVTLNGRPLRNLNELEMVDGLVYANVWKTPFLVAIDPTDGKVRRVIDLTDIVGGIAAADPDAVLNGIAWDADNRRLFVTGKLWPALFQIELVETAGRVE